MIPGTVPTWQVKSWQEELADLITSPRALLELLELDSSWLAPAIAAAKLFPLRVTPSYASRIRKGDPDDPLLRQILPLGDELLTEADYTTDPLQEATANPVRGVVHKYHGRVLFIAATQCAINCRYCFRRHFPYGDNQLNREQWRAALTYVADNPQISEVILSGGDPLSLADKQLAWLTEEIAKISHVTRLRIHTRYPIILPSRITAGLIGSITQTRLQVVMVVHCNHPQEIDPAVCAAFRDLKQAQVTLLNQTVLLRNINDDSEILAALSEGLFNAGVLPYYLHLLDKVTGAAHFAIADQDAKSLYKELLTLLPGYLVPKLVREVPSELSKTPILPDSNTENGAKYSYNP